jgi:hypothetical protein
MQMERPPSAASLISMITSRLLRDSEAGILLNEHTAEDGPTRGHA